MHEVGITRSLVEIAEDHARRAGSKRVLSVSVDIGELSGVVAEAVEFCFSAVTQGHHVGRGDPADQPDPW